MQADLRIAPILSYELLKRAKGQEPFRPPAFILQSKAQPSVTRQSAVADYVK
jgi:hypothetical protein